MKVGSYGSNKAESNGDSLEFTATPLIGLCFSFGPLPLAFLGSSALHSLAVESQASSDLAPASYGLSSLTLRLL